MRSFVILVALSSALVACAPHARSKGTRATTPVATLDARGVPDETWDEEALTAYELDLIRLEQTFGAEWPALRERRARLDQAREKQIAKALKATRRHPRGDAAATDLLRERDELVRQVNASGLPHAAWGIERLLVMKQKLQRIDEIGHYLIHDLHVNALSYDEFTKTARVPLEKALAARVERRLPHQMITGSHLN